MDRHRQRDGRIITAVGLGIFILVLGWVFTGWSGLPSWPPSAMAAEMGEITVNLFDRETMRAVILGAYPEEHAPENWDGPDAQCFMRYGPDAYAGSVDNQSGIRCVTPELAGGRMLEWLCSVVRPKWGFRALARDPATGFLIVACGPSRQGA